MLFCPCFAWLSRRREIGKSCSCFGRGVWGGAELFVICRLVLEYVLASLMFMLVPVAYWRRAMVFFVFWHSGWLFDCPVDLFFSTEVLRTASA